MHAFVWWLSYSIVVLAIYPPHRGTQASSQQAFVGTPIVSVYSITAMLVYTSIHAQASSQQAFVGTLIVSLVPSSEILGLKSGGKGAKVRSHDS